MKKIKKLLAMIMAMTMVLGMSLTSFAAEDTATITINNAGKATFKYLRIVEPDRDKPTGWTFVNGAGDIFVSAFTETGEAAPSEQDVIEMLIAHALPANDPNHHDYTSQFSIALSNVAHNLSTQHQTMNNPQSVDTAGIYSIIGLEEGYTYLNMAAFVGFGEAEDGSYPALEDAVLNAKKTPTTVTKTVGDDDKVVAIGDIVTYTITVNVPFINPNNDDKSFYIYDVIENAEYYLDTENKEDAVFSVKMDGTDVVATPLVGDKAASYGNYDMVIDLKDLIDDANSNAGKTITVTYTAKITALGVNNTAGSHIGGMENDSTSSEVKLYTGIIELLKHDEKEVKKGLQGAEFEVTKSDDPTKTPLKFVEETPGVDGIYIYEPDAEADTFVTTLTTGADGKLVIKGLGVGTYNFKETKAPEGYHVNGAENGIDKAIEIKVNGEAEENITAIDKLANSKLAALPGTGGIGTTIFTIGGCAIMIAAAALYFVNRRKSEEN